MNTDAQTAESTPTTTPPPEETAPATIEDQATPAQPQEAAGNGIAAIADVLGMAEGASEEEVLQRAAALRDLEASAARPEEPKPEPKKTDGATDERFAVYAEVIAQSKLEAEVSSRGFTDQQRSLAQEMLADRVTFDEASGSVKGPHGVKLKTAVDQLVARFPDAFRAPPKTIPTPSEPPPPAGQEAPPAPGAFRVCDNLNLD